MRGSGAVPPTLRSTGGQLPGRVLARSVWSAPAAGDEPGAWSVEGQSFPRELSWPPGGMTHFPGIVPPAELPNAPVIVGTIPAASVPASSAGTTGPQRDVCRRTSTGSSPAE